MFKSILGKTMDTYIDDMVVKSREEADHIRDLIEVFAVLKRHGLGDETGDQSEPRTNYSD